MRAFISIVLGFLLMIPLGWIFGEMNWPTFHGWGLLHGSFIIAWPILAVSVYLALRFIAQPIASASARHDSFVCSQCKTTIQSDAKTCPSCGFVFGNSQDAV
jgi:uncharacterized membrane protein